MACITAKPIVDGLEAEFAAELRVIRVDVQSTAGRELAGEYGVLGTPTFLFFDASGEQAWQQVGDLDAEKVRAALTP